LGFLPKKIEINYVMKDKFLPYKLTKDATYPMQPWFYFPFKGEKHGLLTYKAHYLANCYNMAKLL
jgi:hypothetical protein